MRLLRHGCWLVMFLSIQTRSFPHAARRYYRATTLLYQKKYTDTTDEDYSSSSTLGNDLRSLRRAATISLSVWGFLSSATKALWTDRRTTLRPMVEAMRQFLQTTGIDLELSQTLNRRLLDNLIILGRVQKSLWEGKDIRDSVLLKDKPQVLLSSEDYLRYMRYATAAYGNSMIRAAQLERTGSMEALLQTRERVSEHIQVQVDDIYAVQESGSSASDGEHLLRHYIAVDHAHKEIVLAIRGTFSLSEIVVDVAAFSRPFCGGEAHSEMATMAERVWHKSGRTILKLLQEHPSYDLILTGHSLGAGCASLLNILCHEHDNALVDGRTVRCFVFAAPPCFVPIEAVPRAVSSCTNIIHQRDAVPFLSVDSVRHLFASLRAIEDQRLRWPSRMELVGGFVPPSRSLQEAVDRATRERLKPKAGAPMLTVPAATTLWLWEQTGDRYDAKVCDSRLLASLPIQIDTNMLIDHNPALYEHALHNLY